MEKLKVLTVVGTRPELIRLSRVISKLDMHCNHILVHSGQNYDYELNQIFFDDLKIRKPDFFLDIASKDQSTSNIIGSLIQKIDIVLDKVEPEAFLVLGDTNSALSIIAAKRRKIPTFHMEAGNRCFDQRVPEEINRKIIDHIADINIPYSSIARDYLLSEGIKPEMIIKSGSPMMEVINHNKKTIQNSSILEELELEKGKYFVLSAHREENINDKNKFKSLIELISFLENNYSMPIVFSAHPRTLSMLKEFDIQFTKEVKVIKPIGFNDYIKLQTSSFIVLSDSGTINEESSILNFPAINIRESHERPEAMEEGSVMMLGFNCKKIENGISILKNQEEIIEI